MSLSKLYTRIDFENNTTPALNETNLNLISKAIDDIDDRVIQLGDDVLQYVPVIISKYSDIQTLSENPPYIGANGNWYVWDTGTSAFVDSGQTAQGNGISSIAKTSTAGLVDTYTITYDDGNTSTFAVTNGADGNGISVITKTSTSGLVDTYTITFTDSTTTTFTVTNGSSISSISKTSTAGLVDTYTVTMTDGTTSTFTVTNGADGNGIASISKTATAGLVDTYTITYTDGTTSTFTVTNGSSGDTVTVETTGTASATVAEVTDLKINGSTVFTLSTYMEQSITLSTSMDTIATFTNAAITTDSAIEVYTSAESLTYKSMSTTAGNCDVTFDAVESATTITVGIYIK